MLLSLATAAVAQTTTSSSSVTGSFISGPMVLPVNTVGFASAGPVMAGGVVSGVPYSAEQVTEHVQTLADGTHITQSSQKTMLYRDSQGRTRTERTFPLPPGAVGASGPNIIEINDPVSGAHYILHPQNHTAHKMAYHTMPPLAARLPNPGANPGAGAVWFNAVPAPATIAIAPLPNSAPESPRQEPQVSGESLGTQTIEGLLAEGKRTTTVFPAGSVGNDRPITAISETWMSTELKTQVLSKNSDPRSGESTTRLINISLTEPDAALFQIPAEYEIEDAQTTGTSR